MNKNLLSEKYSNALFQVALKQKKLELVKDELLEFATMLKANPDLLEFITAPVRSEKQISNLLENLLKKLSISDITKNFLFALAKNNRFSCFSSIVEKYEALYNKSQKKLEFVITTAKKLDNEQLKKIQKDLEQIIEGKILLKQNIDDSVISGFTLRCDSILIDNSFASQLNQIKKLSLQELELYKLTEMS